MPWHHNNPYWPIHLVKVCSVLLFKANMSVGQGQARPWGGRPVHLHRALSIGGLTHHLNRRTFRFVKLNHCINAPHSFVQT